MPGIIANILSGGGGGPLGLRKPKGPCIRDHVSSGHPTYSGNTIVIKKGTKPFSFTFKYDCEIKSTVTSKSRNVSATEMGNARKGQHVEFTQEMLDNQFDQVPDLIVTYEQVHPTTKEELEASGYQLGWNDSDYGMPEQSGYGISQYGISQSDSHPILDIMYHK